LQLTQMFSVSPRVTANVQVFAKAENLVIVRPEPQPGFAIS